MAESRRSWREAASIVAVEIVSGAIWPNRRPLRERLGREPTEREIRAEVIARSRGGG